MSHPSGGGLPRFISGSSMIPVLQTANIIQLLKLDKVLALLYGSLGRNSWLRKYIYEVAKITPNRYFPTF
ncbi:hypothetical protein L873DRAFT_292100 [Choiromyces venosus 120613-1]|uniref:Uncharacterized protein n=1 Tax=Choiromyces venosus 120613-1 TaxID=1336337 RepID=A0A3N4J0M0_9PEZI|nr:hypothetical protein L873DRAFT_292100 [Choiromyces venosus 120613-1]